MRNRTEHGLSWLTAISDAGSTPAASTIPKILSFLHLPIRTKKSGRFCDRFVPILYQGHKASRFFDPFQRSSKTPAEVGGPHGFVRLHPSLFRLQIQT